MDEELDTSSSTETESTTAETGSIRLEKVVYDCMSEKSSMSSETTRGSSIAITDENSTLSEAKTETPCLLTNDPAPETPGPTGEAYGQREIIAYYPHLREEEREKSPKRESNIISNLVSKFSTYVSPTKKDDEKSILDQHSSDDSSDIPVKTKSSIPKARSMTETMSRISTGRTSRSKSTYVFGEGKKSNRTVLQFLDLEDVKAKLCKKESSTGIPSQAKSSKGIPSQSTSSTGIPYQAEISKDIASQSSSTGIPSQEESSKGILSQPTSSTSIKSQTTSKVTSLQASDSIISDSESADKPQKRVRSTSTHSSLNISHIPKSVSGDEDKASTSKYSQRARTKSHDEHKIKKIESAVPKIISKSSVKALFSKRHKSVTPDKEVKEKRLQKETPTLESKELKSAEVLLKHGTDSKPQQRTRKLFQFGKSSRSKSTSIADVQGELKRRTAKVISPEHKLKGKSEVHKDISQAVPCSEELNIDVASQAGPPCTESIQSKDCELKQEMKEETEECMRDSEEKQRTKYPQRRTRQEGEESPRKRQVFRKVKDVP